MSFGSLRPHHPRCHIRRRTCPDPDETPERLLDCHPLREAQTWGWFVFPPLRIDLVMLCSDFERKRYLPEGKESFGSESWTESSGQRVSCPPCLLDMRAASASRGTISSTAKAARVNQVSIKMRILEFAFWLSTLPLFFGILELKSAA